MKEHLVLIKLGGGLITDKASPLTIRKRPTTLFAKELATLRKKYPSIDYIVGHGGGSFGHFPAQQYSLQDGAFNTEQFYGMCVTHAAMQQLLSSVTQILIKNHIPVFSLSPSAMMTLRNGRVDSRLTLSVQQLLEHRIIPLLHGDTISDAVRGATILSTEKVLEICMSALRKTYTTITVIYLLNVDGLLDARGHVMPVVKGSDDIIALGGFSHDVTGGIVGKVASAREAARQAEAVYLLNGNTPGLIEQAISGKQVGTKVV